MTADYSLLDLSHGSQIPHGIYGHSIEHSEMGWGCACGVHLASTAKAARTHHRAHKSEVWGAMLADLPAASELCNLTLHQARDRFHVDAWPYQAPLVVRLLRSAVEDGDCWIWTRARAQDGYGHISNRSAKTMRAHQAAYQLAVGPVPDGFELDHICNRPPCMRPTHLRPLTRRENTLRGNAASARNARKTHCAEGHPLVSTPNGPRKCPICRRAYQRAWDARRRTVA